MALKEGNEVKQNQIHHQKQSRVVPLKIKKKGKLIFCV